ncbi:MAG: hypothetical protein ACJA1H_003166 [Glaciecola sp.]
MTQAAACTPPELENTSIVRPKRKLVSKSPALFPLTGYKIINSMYGSGIINPKKFILLKITIWTANNKINRKILTNRVLFIFLAFF